MANTKVQSEQIEDGSITADKLADGTIVAAELANNAVVTAAINADAVTGAKIADDAIDSEHYTDGSIDTAHIADAQITVAKMAANSVDSDQYVDGSIDTVHLGDLQVTTAKIANGNISTAKIADNAVTSAKIDTNIDIAGTFDVTGATTLDSTLAVNLATPFGQAQISDTDWSSGAPYGTVLTVTGNNTNDANWGHLMISDSSTGTGNGGMIRFATGSTSSDMNPFAGIDSFTEGSAYGGLKFLTRPNGGTATARMTILSDGKVGVGTASPSVLFHVANDGSGEADVARFSRTNSSDVGFLDISIDPNNDLAIFDASGSSSQSYVFRSGGTERMRIASSGNVGIGTTSPTQKLDVVSTSAGNTTIPLVVRNSGSTSTGTEAKLFLSTVADDARGAFVSAIITDSSNGNALLLGTNTAGASPVERMRIDSSGNVGIGESSPLVPLHISKDSASGENIALLLDNNNTTASNEIAMLFRSAVGSTNTDFQIAAISNGANDMDLTFASDGGSERMRIASSGKVGIGENDPTAYYADNLVVKAPSEGGITIGASANSHTNYIMFAESASSGAAGYRGYIGYYHNATTTSGRMALSSQGYMTFFTNSGEKMRIDSDGDVGIGTTNPNAVLHVAKSANLSEAGAHLRLEGAGFSGFHWLDSNAYYIGQNSSARVLALYSGAETAGVQLTNGSTSWSTFSDERLKENIKDIGSVTDKIKDIRCVSFNRTDIEDSKETIGFIAQDFVGKFDQVLNKSKLKDGDEEEYYSIKYTETIPVLLKAIQEQQEQIEQLKSEIEALKS